jgi:hypothetical protein
MEASLTTPLWMVAIAMLAFVAVGRDSSRTKTRSRRIRTMADRGHSDTAQPLQPPLPHGWRGLVQGGCGGAPADGQR